MHFLSWPDYSEKLFAAKESDGGGSKRRYQRGATVCNLQVLSSLQQRIKHQEHQRLYYNHDTKEWLKTEQDGIDHTDSEDESDFSYIDSDSSFKDSNNNCDLEDWVTEDSEEEDSNVEEMEQQSRHDEEHPMYSMPSSELTKGKHT